VTTGITM